MPEEYLRPVDVEREYGLTRADLTKYENVGVLRSQRTQGGQRRYTRTDIDNLFQTQAAAGNPIPVDDESRFVFREFGTTGLNRWSATATEEKLRELRGRRGRELLKEMRINDPVISAIFFAIESALRQATWRVKPASESKEDTEVAKFVESCLHDMSFTWSDTLSFIFGFLEQGFSIVEIVYKVRSGKDGDPESTFDDGRIGWRKWSPRPALTLMEGSEWIIDDNGGIQGCRQVDPNGRQIIIPINKMLLFRTTVGDNNSPEGRPIHRSMYAAWWYSQNIMEIEGIGIERDLAGIPVVYLGNDTSKTGPTSDYTMAQELVTNLRNDEQAGVVIPKPKMGSGAAEGDGILLELLSSSGRRAYDTSAIIERYDKRKALAVLAQFIMLGMERVGSYALSKSQGDLFVISVTSLLTSIADVINQYAIKRLVKYNVFPGITGYPQLVPGTVGVPDLTEIATYVNTMVQQELITPDPELERHLRQLAHLPEYKPPVVEYDADGNPINNGAGPRQDISIEKAALLVRRVGLATKGLVDLGVLDSQSAIDLLSPLVQELKDGIDNELLLGGTMRRQKLTSATEEEIRELDNPAKDEVKPPLGDEEEV